MDTLKCNKKLTPLEIELLQALEALIEKSLQTEAHIYLVNELFHAQQVIKKAKL